MDIDTYLRSELKSINKEVIQPDEEKMLKLNQLAYFIEQRLLSKKFRKNFLKEETKKTIRQKIEMSVKSNKPIYLIFAFGGYKNPWVEEYYPHAEWAELFHLIYILKLLTPIAKHYKPGIFLQYESECEATIYHNNFSKEDLDKYTESFKKLIDFIKPFAPENITFSYLTLPEQYDTKKFFAEMSELVPAKMESLRESLGDGLDEALKRPLFNLNRKGPEDLSNKSEKELKEIALRSLAFNNVFLEEDYKIREHYFNGDERISMVGTYCSQEENPDNWISINSCARSANAFWTSRGILLGTEKGFETDIVGPNEFKQLHSRISFKGATTLSSLFPDIVSVPVLEGK